MQCKQKNNHSSPSLAPLPRKVSYIYQIGYLYIGPIYQIGWLCDKVEQWWLWTQTQSHLFCYTHTHTHIHTHTHTQYFCFCMHLCDQVVKRLVIFYFTTSEDCNHAQQKWVMLKKSCNKKVKQASEIFPKTTAIKERDLSQPLKTKSIRVS